MRRFICCFLAVCLLLPTVVYATSVSTEYGSISISKMKVTEDNLVVTAKVNALNKDAKYFIELCIYEFSNNKLIEVFSSAGGSDDIFTYGKNQIIELSVLLDNLYYFDEGVYAFQLILRDGDVYEEDDWDSYACFAWSKYYIRNIEFKDDEICISKYSCEEHGHVYGKWKVTKDATVFEKGSKAKTCYSCGKIYTKSIACLEPSIELSTTSKTLKELHSFNLKVSNIATGDSIESVKISSSKIISVSRSNQTITVKGKKEGTATVTVTLKSGKKEKCTVKVVPDKFTYTVKNLKYSTRDNVFTVKLKNTAKHSVTIYAADAKLIDWDYKKYDRTVKNVNGKSSIKIEPGETVSVKFKLNSKSTWPGYERKTIKFKVKFDGQTKWIKISENDW